MYQGHYAGCFILACAEAHGVVAKSSRAVTVNLSPSGDTARTRNEDAKHDWAGCWVLLKNTTTSMSPECMTSARPRTALPRWRTRCEVLMYTARFSPQVSVGAKETIHACADNAERPDEAQLRCQLVSLTTNSHVAGVFRESHQRQDDSCTDMVAARAA